MILGESGFQCKTKWKRKRGFLDEMKLLVQLPALVSLIAPYAPSSGTTDGRLPFTDQAMLRIHFLQPWFNRSDPAMEEALCE